uniref:Uncharacterized protein n=1 Tax=Serratia marcescens TaxID=615 RepID=A0A345INV7_SERMA|nr:hypothetical protein [Serratia marcescens]
MSAFGDRAAFISSLLGAESANQTAGFYLFFSKINLLLI